MSVIMHLGKRDLCDVRVRIVVEIDGINIERGHVGEWGEDMADRVAHALSRSKITAVNVTADDVEER